MKRLFTFGCSFTQYAWPTWADVLGQQFDQYENWGKSGAGNLFIACAVSECHVKNQLGADDTVAIMWSSITREDRYFDNYWHTPGNIYSQDSLYDAAWIKKYADPRGYLIRDLSMVNLVAGFLDSLGVQYYFLSMMDLDAPETGVGNDDNNNDILWYYEDVLKKIRPSVHKVIFNYDYKTRPCDIIPRTAPINAKNKIKWSYDPKNVRQDLHPSPIEHLEYLDKVLPEISIDTATRNWVTDMTEKLRDPEFDIESVWDRSTNCCTRL
jgi:hypothetical protein